MYLFYSDSTDSNHSQPRINMLAQTAGPFIQSLQIDHKKHSFKCCLFSILHSFRYVCVLPKCYCLYVSHSWKGTIGYVKVRYEGGESGKMGQSLREREGIRKELWYVDDQSVYESRLRIRAKRAESREAKGV